MVRLQVYIRMYTPPSHLHLLLNYTTSHQKAKMKRMYMFSYPTYRMVTSRYRAASQHGHQHLPQALHKAATTNDNDTICAI